MGKDAPFLQVSVWFLLMGQIKFLTVLAFIWFILLN